MNSKLVLICLFPLFAGAAAVAPWLWEKRQESRLAKEGKLASGWIDGGREITERRRVYWFDVSFTTHTGERIRRTIAGDGDFVGHRLAGLQLLNPVVEVRYLPGNPRVISIPGMYQPIPEYAETGFIVLGVGVLATVIVLVVLFCDRKRSQAG